MEPIEQLNLVQDLNLADLARDGLLTIQHVQQATKDTLETDRYSLMKFTVLFCATWKCSYEVVEAILNKGVDLNQISTSNNMTALVGTVDETRWDIVMLLLNRGADASIKTGVG
jgi:ankyrin repeat protein